MTVASAADLRLANNARTVVAKALAIAAGLPVADIDTAPVIEAGTGSPDGVVTANAGGLYLRFGGTPGLWINTDGATAWSQILAGAPASGTITDTANFYGTDTINAALQEIAAALGGATSTARNYSSNTAVADNDSAVVAIGKLDAAVASATASAATGIADAASASALAATKAPTVPIAYSFPAAASDTIAQSIPFPFAGAKVARIQVAPNGAAGTGTLTAKQGIAGAGNTLLNAASFDLSTLTGSTATGLTLTATAADLLGGLGSFIEIEIVNATAAHEVVVTFQVA